MKFPCNNRQLPVNFQLINRTIPVVQNHAHKMLQIPPYAYKTPPTPLIFLTFLL